jgi:Bacterial capsule synthesis protein PGA_cap
VAIIAKNSERNDAHIFAIGDISFEGSNYIEPAFRIFKQVSALWSNSDFVACNLESPLLEEGIPAIGKCVLKGNPGWAEIMHSAGIKLVSLANNHMMDYGSDGLLSTIETLKAATIPFIGAGDNIENARQPYFEKINGIETSFLARSSVIVNSPDYIASSGKPGVAFLDPKEVKSAICECKKQADKVILFVHWGLEHYNYPPVSQKKLAKDLIEAGVDLVIGHHPHVLQGTERISSGVVCHSLGNFIFDDVYWSFVGQEGEIHKRIIRLNSANREGGALRVDLAKNRIEYKFIPTVIKADGSVDVDDLPERKKNYNLLSARLQMACYNVFWQIYALGREWNLRIKPMIEGKMSWSNIKKIRLRHIKQLVNKLGRSAKVASEKTTDPYE